MRSMKMLGLAVLATLALGCGDDGSGPNGGNGSHSITVSGDATASLSGNAYFQVTTVDPDTYFGIALTDASPTSETFNHFLYIDRDGGRPGPGTYTVGVEAGNIDAGLMMDDGATLWYATAGSVTITSSSASGVNGTFSFTAEDFGGNTVTITGSFQAACLDDDVDTSCG